MYEMGTPPYMNRKICFKVGAKANKDYNQDG